MQKKLMSALMLVLVSLAVVVPIAVALADQPQGPQVGDVLKLESVRGTAYDPATEQTTKATLSLMLTVSDVDGRRLRLTVTGGQISFGDNTYSVQSGEGGALVAKFGWIAVHGIITLPDGTTFNFRLEGMLHIERKGLVVTGLIGGLGNETSRYHLRFAARLSRA